MKKHNLWQLLFCLFISSIWGFHLQAAIPQHERAALIALYQSTGGDNWKYQNGWKSPPLLLNSFSWYSLCKSPDAAVIHCTSPSPITPLFPNLS